MIAAVHPSIPSSSLAVHSISPPFAMSARRGGDNTKTIRLTGNPRSHPHPVRSTSSTDPTSSFPVVAADSLIKRDVFRLPDPFAVITVDGEQTHTTSVIKKTLNPYWNENFDM